MKKEALHTYHNQGIYNAFKKGLNRLVGVVLCLVFMSMSVGQLQALEGVGAKVDRVGNGPRIELRLKTFPLAVVSVVDEENTVWASAIDKGSGELIFAFNTPLDKGHIIAVISSDGFGITEPVKILAENSVFRALLPPTIYVDSDIEPTPTSLGIIGYSFPDSRVNIEMDGDTGEKLSFFTVADSTGEWQIQATDLAPGVYQARAKASYLGEESEFSQALEIEVLRQEERLVRNIGVEARQGIERFTGSLPEPAQDVYEQVDKNADVVSKYVVPAALTVGSLAQAGLIARNLLYFLMQGALAIGQLFGLVKRRQQWGIVYDSVSKKPLVRAIVRLYNAQTRELEETDVSNKSGVFSFLPKSGEYYLWASRPGYTFPSQLVTGDTDGEYRNVYTGGTIRLSDRDAVINSAIPLDPVEYEETLSMKLNRVYNRYIAPYNKYLLFIGAMLAVLSFTRTPNVTNFGVLVMYIMGLGVQGWMILKKRRDWGMVVDSSGHPVDGVALTLTDIEYNRLVSRRLSDEEGRYQFVAPPGRYKIRVVSTDYELVDSAEKAYQGQEVLVQGKEGEEALITPKIVVQKD